MPPLQDMLKTQTLSGFEAVENPKTPPPPLQWRILSNPIIRCPLPPFSTTVDTLRQFNEGGSVPARRVIPLPVSVQAGGGSTIINEAVTSSGGGGSSSAVPKLIPVSAVTNVPLLTPLGVFQTTLQLQSKSFQLLRINSSNPVEVRVYATAAIQASDVVRLTDTAVPFEIVPGIIVDVVFDTSPFNWSVQNIIGANADTTQNSNIYVSVINPSSTTSVSATTVTLTYLPLES